MHALLCWRHIVISQRVPLITGFIPQATFENHYLYKVMQTQFNKGSEETINISCTVKILCEAGKILKIYFYDKCDKYHVMLLSLSWDIWQQRGTAVQHVCFRN